MWIHTYPCPHAHACTGVQNNPTQHLCEWLATEPSVSSRCNVEIIHAETLCVAAQDVVRHTLCCSMHLDAQQS
eukprot:1140278-Pelagomonas_calceolata.AAC.1